MAAKPAGSEDERLKVHFSDPPKAALLFELHTGDVLWKRRAGGSRPIASLVKLMTALIAVERLEADERVRISREAADTPPVEIGLKQGTKVRVETLLAGMLISSGNDAATALAEGAAGSAGRFVKRMNKKAKRLDLRCTRFASSHGIESGNRSCPSDLARLTQRALSEERIAGLVRKRGERVRIPGRGKVKLRTTNPLLRDRYEGTIGVKTGFTSAAGRCLIAAARRGGRTLVAVLLHSPDTAGQARKLLDKGFRSY